MHAGELRDRIILMKQPIQKGAFKDLNPTYEEYKPLWAKAEYFKVNEVYKNDADNAISIMQFVVRYREDVENNMKVKFKGEFYDVKGARPIEGYKTWLLIICEMVK